jgi:multiple sugar transport system substrate-binding protein
MKTVQKYISVLFVFLLIVIFAAGCTKENDNVENIVHFVTWKPNIPDAWEEIFRIFKEEHPEITIEREVGPHSSTAFHDLLTQKLKNRSSDVDVFLMDVIWPPEFAAAGWAMPLDEVFPKSEQTKFLPSSILANTYGNTIFGVPLFIDSGILYYRKDLLEKYRLPVPRTWNDLIMTSEWIVSEEKRAGKKIEGFSGQFKQYEGLVCDMMEYILSNGGMILDPVSGKPALTGKPAIEAVQFVRDKIIGKAAPEGVLTYQEPESLDLFIQGGAVFHRNWPYAWEVSNNPDKSRIAGKVGITTLPHFKGYESYSTLGGWQVGISNFSENKEAAWTFVQFLTSSKVQKILALQAGRAPTRKALYSDEAILRDSPHFVEMKNVFHTAYPRPRTALYPAVSNILQRYFSKAISSPDTDVEKEARTASIEIEKILELEKDAQIRDK